MLNRVRMEAKGATEQQVADELASASAFVKETFGGSWVAEDAATQTTGKGYWGRVTLRLVETQ